MDTTHLEFIRDNSIKEGITYPILNRDKYPYAYQVYFNDNLNYEDMVNTLAPFTRNEYPYDYHIYGMLKDDWIALLIALKNTPKNTVRVSLRRYEYYAYYKVLK